MKITLADPHPYNRRAQAQSDTPHIKYKWKKEICQGLFSAYFSPTRYYCFETFNKGPPNKRLEYT